MPKTVSSPANTGVIGELRERSQAGDAGASYDLAVRFHKGVGVAVNFGEAIRLYQLAAEQGSSEAQKYCRSCYQEEQRVAILIVCGCNEYQICFQVL